MFRNRRRQPLGEMQDRAEGHERPDARHPAPMEEESHESDMRGGRSSEGSDSEGRAGRIRAMQERLECESRAGALNAYELAKGRRDEILKIEEQLTELLDMFQDLAALVDEQQEQIDDIQNNIRHALKDIEAGNMALVEANRLLAESTGQAMTLAALLLGGAVVAGEATGILPGLRGRR